jgi:hypothetical protein
MENCKRIISQLGALRNVPQFFFCSDVSRYSLVLFRKELRDYLDKNHEDPNHNNEIDFIINSGGGDADAAYKIITILKGRFKKVNVIVPLWAKSAATLISLGADEIIIDEMGEFGPLDPQIPKEKEDSPDFDFETSLIDESALQLIEEKAQVQFLNMFINIHEHKRIRIDRKEISRQIFHYISEFYTPLLSQIDPYKMGQKNRITRIASEYAAKILSRTKTTSVNSRRLIYYLANECPVHGFVVDYEQIKQFGLNIKLSDEIGVEYERRLRELSDYMSLSFDHGNNAFIGFIPTKKSTTHTEETKSEPSSNLNEKQNGKAKKAETKQAAVK